MASNQQNAQDMYKKSICMLNQRSQSQLIQNKDVQELYQKSLAKLSLRSSSSKKENQEKHNQTPRGSNKSSRVLTELPEIYIKKVPKNHKGNTMTEFEFKTLANTPVKRDQKFAIHKLSQPMRQFNLFTSFQQEKIEKEHNQRVQELFNSQNSGMHSSRSQPEKNE